MKKFFLFLLLGFYTLIAFGESDNIKFLPGFGKPKQLELAGYLPISADTQSFGKLYYWFVSNHSNQKDAPLVLWLNGGPGAASLYGFFMENGPYSVNEDKTLSERQYTWAQQANYLIIDQPAGVGFSYEGKKSFRNEAEAMDQLYYALNHFFAQNPALRSKPLYLAGESYAGKYIPKLAMRILQGNKKQKTPLLLKGILLGDAWVNPKLQQAANADYAYYHGLIDQRGYQKVLKLYQDCVKEIEKATPSTRQANKTCEKIQELIQKKSGLALTNIMNNAEPNDAYMINYLNRSDVRTALHVSPKVKRFNTFNEKVSQKLEIGEQDSVAPLYADLLKAGILIWIYNGLDDAKDSNFLSTERWLAALQWSGQKEFANAPTCLWRVDKKVAGYMKTAKGLTQIKIRNAGHLAPIDQPAVLLDVFNHFIHHQPLCNKLTS